MKNTTVDVCASCGQPLLKAKLIDLLDGTPHPLCPRCASLLSKCNTCINQNKCAFHDDPDPTPKTFRKQIQSGPFTQIIEEANPERISKTCANACLCYDSSLGCAKQQFQFCRNYKPIWEV